MKTKEAYNVLFVDYPDIVNVESIKRFAQIS